MMLYYRQRRTMLREAPLAAVQQKPALAQVVEAEVLSGRDGLAVTVE